MMKNVFKKCKNIKNSIKIKKFRWDCAPDPSLGLSISCKTPPYFSNSGDFAPLIYPSYSLDIKLHDMIYAHTPSPLKENI